MIVHAFSQTQYVQDLLEGPVAHGVSLGHGHLCFSGHVLSLTRPGGLRMPNGLECDLSVPRPGEFVRIGAGSLACNGASVRPGPLWNPRPHPRFIPVAQPRLSAGELLALAGQGPGLTPVGDDVVIGYLAAQALFGGPLDDASALAGALAARTTSLSGTLLRLAARGHLPEAAHRLLEGGDPEPLLSWGATSGAGLLAGLGHHGALSGAPAVRTLEICLPLRSPRVLYVEIRELPS